jgi:putative N6-adenine-specific DNA methylase
VDTIFCACSPGLEPLLAEELRALGLEARAVEGGAEARGEDAVALACLGARLADSVALRVYEGPQRGLDAAIAAARRRLGERAELAVRRAGAAATVSLDAAGAPLFRRGWRARVGAAPLRETVAAALLAVARWDGRAPLLDPFCGSGTVAIEAALVAAGRAPGAGRRFAFEGWPRHDPARTAAIRARLEAASPAGAAGDARILASDRNAGVLRLAQKNAAAAGVAGAIRFARVDAAEAEAPPGRGVVVTNPPWGGRLEDAAPAWAALGRLLDRLPGWPAVVLGPARGLDDLVGRPVAAERPLRIGGVRCRILAFGDRC